MQQDFSVFIEAGHGVSILGINDNGAIGNGHTERDMNIKMANAIIDRLTGKVKNVFPVGVTTKASTIKKEKYINQVVKENTIQKAIAVSLHMNSTTIPWPSGLEIWYQTNRPSKLAETVLNSIKEYNVIPLRPRPLMPTYKNHWGRLYIDDSYIPHILIEVGFISNPGDVELIDKERDRIAESIAHGIINYTNL